LQKSSTPCCRTCSFRCSQRSLRIFLHEVTDRIPCLSVFFQAVPATCLSTRLKASLQTCTAVVIYVYLLYLMCICVSYVYLLYFYVYLCVDAGLLARSQYPEGPPTGHLDTGFSWFPSVYKQMLRWFPSSQVATTCFSCRPPDLNFLVTFFYVFVYV